MKALLTFPYARNTAVDNMALDAAMLTAGCAQGLACWRSYGWTEPAITFGYSQKWAWVLEAMQPYKGAAVRRMTGGGIVDHRKDFTYALSLPPENSVHRLPALELYQQFHECVVVALQRAGLEAAQAPCPGPCGESARTAGLCFQQAEPYDVVDPQTGTKIAGAAMKRNTEGVLIQGSMTAAFLEPAALGDFEKIIAASMADWLDLTPELSPDPLPASLVEAAAERFSSPDWNRKR